MTYTEFAFVLACILACVVLGVFMGVWELTHPVNPEAFIVK